MEEYQQGIIGIGLKMKKWKYRRCENCGEEILRRQGVLCTRCLLGRTPHKGD